jgi:hypothetical protein
VEKKPVGDPTAVQQTTSTPHTGGATTNQFPILEGPRDGNFLRFPDHIAGRQACIELFTRGDSRKEREHAWRSRQATVNMARLGAAAKALEEAGINWRELAGHEEIFEAHNALLRSRTN